MSSLKYPRFRQKHGEPFDQRPVPQETFDHYTGKVPDELLELWKADGWCGYGNGFLWLIDPAEYRHILIDWFGPNGAAGKYAFLRTAFGGFLYWDQQAIWQLDFIYGQGPSPVPRRFPLLFDGTLQDPGYLNDVLQYAHFRAAYPTLGRLNRDECYGYIPPILAGGPGTLETVQRLDLSVHMDILIQLARPEPPPVQEGE